MIQKLLYPSLPATSGSVGILIVRLVMGTAFIFHGWPKVMKNGEIVMFHWMAPDAPVPGALQAAAALTEAVGGGLLILGLFTPAAALLLAIVMTVAIGMVHLPQGHPFVNVGGPSYELAAIYLAGAVLLLLTGAGKFSLDAVIFGPKPTVVKEGSRVAA